MMSWLAALPVPLLLTGGGIRCAGYLAGKGLKLAGEGSVCEREFKPAIGGNRKGAGFLGMRWGYGAECRERPQHLQVLPQKLPFARGCFSGFLPSYLDFFMGFVLLPQNRNEEITAQVLEMCLLVPSHVA